MSDERDSNNGELTLSKNRSLAVKQSDLVTRGLQLAHQIKRPQLRVFLANNDDLINETGVST